MFFDNTNNYIKIKICGICDVDIARFAVNEGADAIGLMFYKQSPRFVTLEQAALIIDAVEGKADIIGVFVNADEIQIEKAIALGITGLQFHGNESLEFCSQWSLPWLKAISVDNNTNINSEIRVWKQAFACLLDTKVSGIYGGSGKVFDWSVIPDKIKCFIVLSGGLTSHNIESAIEQVNPFALDVSSGVESSRGVKSKALIKQFISKVKHD